MAIQSPTFQQQDWIAALPRIKCVVARNDAVGGFVGALVLAFVGVL